MRGRHIDRGRIRIKKGARIMGIKPVGGSEVRLPSNIWMEYSVERDGSGATVNHPAVGALYLPKRAEEYASIEVQIYSRTDWMREKGKEGVRLGGRYSDSFYNGRSENIPFRTKKLWSQE